MKRLRKVSKKMAAQKVKERALRKVLLVRCKGCCELCHVWFGEMLQKHEKITRGQCGDPLDPTNTVMLCNDCHEAQRGVKVIHASPQWSKKE